MLADGLDDFELRLFVEHLVGEPAGDDHVGSDLLDGAFESHGVGQITFGEVEELVEGGLCLFGEFLPGLDELLVSVFSREFQGVAYGIVPESIDLHLVSVSRGYGESCDHGVHPRQWRPFRGSPDQSVVIEDDPSCDSLLV